MATSRTIRARADEARRLTAVRTAFARGLPTTDRYARGRAALIRGDYAAALTAFRAEAKRVPHHYSARIGAALALALAGKRSAAWRAFAALGLVERGHDLRAATTQQLLDGLSDLAWEYVGAESSDVDRVANEAYAAGDYERAATLGRGDLRVLAQLRTSARGKAIALARKARGLSAQAAATILLDAGEPIAALPLFQTLSRSDRSNWSDSGGDARRELGWSGRALVHHLQGEHTQALAAVQQVRAVRSTAEAALLVEVAALAALGFTERAVAALRAIENHYPLVDIAWGGIRRSALEVELLGAEAARRVALERAERVFAHAWPEARDDRDALGEAIALYRRALGDKPGRAEVRRADGEPPTLREPHGSALLRWSLAHARRGERAQAVTIAQRLLRADPDNLSALRVIAWAGAASAAKAAYAAAGIAPQIHGSLLPGQRTLAAYRALSARDALSPVRYSRRERARQLGYFGMYREQLVVLEAIDLAPGEPLRFAAAYAAEAIDQRARAWKLIEPYLRVHRDTASYAQTQDAWWLGERVAPAAKRTWVTARMLEIWDDADEQRPPATTLAQRELHERAFAEERAGRMDKAVALYLRAIEIVPAADITGNAANILVDRGELARADAWFALVRIQLADLAPPIRRGWQLAKLAWRYWESRDVARAGLLAARAAQLTHSPGDYHTLAECRRAAGDLEAARDALRDGLALDPTHDDLRALRSELETA